MPCRSDYLEPTERERESKLVAELIVWLMNRLKRHSEIPKDVLEAANNAYGDQSEVDVFTQMLCKLVYNLTAEQQDMFLWNGRDAHSRKLADWWDKHQELDRQRAMAVEENERKAKAWDSAYAKLNSLTLSGDEMDALRNYFRNN